MGFGEIKEIDSHIRILEEVRDLVEEQIRRA